LAESIGYFGKRWAKPAASSFRDVAMLPAGFSRFPVWRRWFGLRSERAAARFLRKQGWRILGRNVDDHLGEIDVLALDNQTLVVVEVRSSESRTFDELAATVNQDKQRRLTDAIVRFIQRRRLQNVGVRFDVLAIRWPPSSREPEVRHYRHAFQAVGKYQFHN
jgi:putative endonuclease